MKQHATVLHGTQWVATPASENGTRSALQEIGQETLGGRLIRMAKQPTTTPRWLQVATHGALVITILAGVISYGRSAGRTEKALASYEQVPQIQSNVNTLSAQMSEIKGLIEKQGNDRAAQDKRIDALQQQTMALTQQLNSLNSSFGSVWALAQSDSNKMSKLEGMLTAMQLQQQQRKDK